MNYDNLKPNCTECNIEIGGYFGNKVYRHQLSNLCKSCGEKSDPIVQLAIAQTGMKPEAYQDKYGVAWNE